MRKFTEVEIGTRYGRLITAKPIFMKQRSDGRNRAAVEVKCDCGNTKIVWASNLFSGNTTSCGCFHKEVVSEQMTTNGASAGDNRHNRPRLYRIWRGMRQRCHNSNAQNYKWYGAKGISCCKDWDNFESFRVWSEINGYADGLELDRIDSDKNYDPENCRWVTKKQNIRNRDMFWSEELDGALIKYSKERGMNPYAVIEQAVTALIMKGGED
jgi:hypothetical protein